MNMREAAQAFRIDIRRTNIMGEHPKTHVLGLDANGDLYRWTGYRWAPLIELDEGRSAVKHRRQIASNAARARWATVD